MFKFLIKSYVRLFGRNVVLCFHSVSDKGLSKNSFIKLIELLEEVGYRFPDPNKSLFSENGKSAIITFDDGYRDNLEITNSFLCKKNIKPIIFVITKFLEGSIKDNAKYGIKNINHMTIEEAEASKKIVHFGFHTHSHDDIAKQDVENIYTSFSNGMGGYEKLLNKNQARYFAYPFGHLPKEQQEFNKLLEEFKFDRAFTTRWGAINKSKYRVNRVVIGDNDSPTKALLKISGLLDAYALIKWRS
ncbi:polysaccharide deacetylase family protein [Cobetia sp. MMG027]|uniref:polysaccharide deacetylase family protein n=1 Tax=Cobetia sp. MMG027 TaxID=3021980 RepID=UPI0022FF38AF|nr:polysaccharide deacetylase family protein [Cobetia sp. MMG027]MDA5565377.1 polysaccharide deacetylase family protein [Cobetia sp. MMG027]